MKRLENTYVLYRLPNQLIFKMTHKTLSKSLAELTVLNIAFLTVLLMNGTDYLIILENQIVLKLLKRMF